MFVGLGMAEIVSAIPSAGGPYFWAAILAPKKWVSAPTFPLLQPLVADGSALYTANHSFAPNMRPPMSFADFVKHL